MYNLHSVVYESRDYSANHPCAAQRTDNQQYDNGGSHSRHIVGNCYFVISPGNPVESYAYKDANGCGGEQGYLASAAQSVTAESADGGKQHSY